MIKTKGKRRYIFLGVVMMLGLLGCGQEEITTLPDDSSTAVESPVMTDANGDTADDVADDVTEEIQTTSLKQCEDMLFSYKDMLPIIVDGKTLAFAKINQLERVGIYDWYNSKAVEKNIKHSYSLNLSIINKEDSILTVTVTPTLINKQNTEVSSKCKVGWTGFGESAEFYEKGNIPIEVGLQPEVRSEKNLRLKLVFNTSAGDSEPIIISNKIFDHVVKGASLKESGDETKITSVNGAKYAFVIGKVYREQNIMDLNTVTAIEFDNSIKYLKAPTKKLEVSMFDSKKKHAMYANLMIGMQTQHNSNLTYDNDDNACRPDYFGGFTDYYASVPDKTLTVGKSVKYHLNRKLSEGYENERFVRFCVEFPEDAKVASLEEMLKFNGRFIVYQCEAHKRTAKYEG